MLSKRLTSFLDESRKLRRPPRRSERTQSYVTTISKEGDGQLDWTELRLTVKAYNKENNTALYLRRKGRIQKGKPWGKYADRWSVPAHAAYYFDVYLGDNADARESKTVDEMTPRQRQWLKALKDKYKEAIDRRFWDVPRYPGKVRSQIDQDLIKKIFGHLDCYQLPFDARFEPYKKDHK